MFSLTIQFRYVYSVESGRVTDSIYAHDDAVSCISLKGDVLASGSWDSTVKVKLFQTAVETFGSPMIKLTRQRSLNAGFY
jgi:WD40 repeat protein